MTREDARVPHSPRAGRPVWYRRIATQGLVKLRDRRGTTTLEFGLIAVPVFLFVLGIMETAYDLFVQVTLDRVAEESARQVQVGNATGTAGETSATFVANVVCPATNSIMNCNQIIAAVAPVPSGYDYYTNPNSLSITTAGSTGGSICTGSASQLMLIQLWYLGPSFVGNFIPGFTSTYGSSTYHITAASAGFVNEETIPGQTSGVGC